MDAAIQDKIIYVLLFMPGFLFSLSVHEASHALMASLLGDNTARSLGRVTLNPIAHSDLLGTIILPILGLFSGFFFGWGKPVPVDYRNLKNIKRDGMFIAAAGPASNIILAIVFAVVIRVYEWLAPSLINDLFQMYHAQLIGQALVQYLFLNLALCFFNLIPVQPLDGSKILYGILPRGLAETVDQFSTRYGLLILILLIATGTLRMILWPPIQAVGRLLLDF